MPKSIGMHGLRILAAGLAACVVVSTSRAQAPTPVNGPDLTGLFNKAITAFQSGDYQGAISNIDNLIANLPKDLPPKQQEIMVTQLEPIFYTRGAAYFNLKKYDEATKTLKAFIDAYPHSNRLVEARFSMAEASYLSKDFEGAAAAFAAIEAVPRISVTLREQAMLYEGLSYKEAGKVDNAITAFEKLTNGGIKSYTSSRGAMQLVLLFSQKKQPDKALKMLADLQTSINYVENVVELNEIALQQGDAFLQADTPDAVSALVCYRAVRTKEEVIRLETDRIAALQKQVEVTQDAMRAAPKEAAQYLLGLKHLQDSMAEDKQLLAEFSKLPSIRPKLYYRMARACTQLGEPWQAIVAYNDSLNAAKDPEDREPALFGLVTSYNDIRQYADARQECNKYLKDFPTGPNAFTVGFVLGASELQEGDPKQAESYFGTMLQQQPTSTLREEMMFLLGNAEFSQGKYAEASAQFDRYMSEYPKDKGTRYEESYYRKGLCSLFAGKYPEALKAANDYLALYPNGAFAQDAKYRRAVCQYAGGDYESVIKGCEEWVQTYPGDPQAAEVQALLGDAYAATDKPDQALDAYTRSYKAVPIAVGAEEVNDQVLNYSLMEAAKILQKKGDWEKVAEMFEEFVKTRPDHPTDVAAAFWIGRADAKLGKVDEAKHFLADMVRKYIDDPKKDAVEQILDQLVALCVKKKRPPAPAPTPADVAAASPGPSASPGASPVEVATALVATPAPTPDAAPKDPGAELDDLLGAALQDRSPTARARIIYAKSQLAAMRRQIPESERNLMLIASDFKPQELSPIILGAVGDLLLGKGKYDQAAPFYNHLLEYYAKSDEADYAYSGLGEVAFQKKQYEKALQLFSESIDNGTANTKLKELTVGKAKSLLALHKLDEAKKLFEQAASVREWRGETTAFSVYELGQIEAEQGHWAEANAYFQRVYVGYQRFLPWVARAYLGSAESLQKLGKPQDAANTLKEMLRNEKLAGFAEADEARKRLSEMGQG